MYCSRFLAVDQDIIPTGEIKDVTGTPLDFTAETPIGLRIDQVPGGYDHCYVVDPAEGGLKPVLSAWDPKSGRFMELSSTQPGVQLYTGNFLDGIRGREGAAYHKHAAFCTETQAFPNAVNQPDFPSAILEPGQTYSHRSVFRFSVRFA
jgi:aldose 1-epimerase